MHTTQIHSRTTRRWRRKGHDPQSIATNQQQAVGALPVTYIQRTLRGVPLIDFKVRASGERDAL